MSEKHCYICKRYYPLRLLNMYENKLICPSCLTELKRVEERVDIICTIAIMAGLILMIILLMLCED